uniref:Uncharacterized protein n=1 Tax=Onchocerca volvulus TaxID=6282 RepID=A0A8R1TSH1_ONCVO
MGDRNFDKMTMCFDTLEACQKSCVGWQCIHADYCDGYSNKYICSPIDSRLLSWIMIGSFLIVVLCCSMLVACYACWLLQIRLRYPIQTNYKVTFQNRLPPRT